VWSAVGGLEDVQPFLEDPEPPRAVPSIVNANELGLPRIAAQAPTKEGQQ